ncbi:hypothetical protein D3C84_742830 [compost metagenome]
MTSENGSSTPVGVAPHGDKKSSVDGAYKMKPTKPSDKNNGDDGKKEPKNP